MSGLLAIASFSEDAPVGRRALYALRALEHRGGSRAVACFATEKGIECSSGESVRALSVSPGARAVVAAVYSSPSDCSVTRIEAGGEEAIALCSRPCPGARRAIEEAVSEALRGRNPVIDTEIPSFVALTSSGSIVAVRDSAGLTPLSVGGLGFDAAVIASETPAIEVSGASPRDWLRPGEGVVVSRHLAKRVEVRGAARRGHALCSFELLYITRHDAIVDGVPVYSFRKMLGYELGRVAKLSSIDVVTGIPETAIPYAIGLSQAIGKPFEIGFVPTGGERIRAALQGDPLARLVAIHMKMNPVAKALEGKSVALVDDSMVTGATAKTVSQILRYRVGVRELHLFIASPPLVSDCPHGVLSYDRGSLLAANMSARDAARYLEVDSLHWVDRSSLELAARVFGVPLCAKCFGIGVVGGSR